MRARVRCVRWSRPPVRIETPRRRRDTTTRHVSSAGTPTSSRPITSACHSAAAEDAPIITSAAIAKPIGMLPPSPRKIRAEGRDRLRGRNPRHAPHNAAPVATSQTSDSTSPSTATAAATTHAIVLDAPSMLSKRLNALTTATTQNAVATRSSTGPSPSDQPSPAAHSSPASPTSTVTRSHTATNRRSSSVPTAHSTTTPPMTGSVWRASYVSASTVTTKPAMTAAPPR